MSAYEPDEQTRRTAERVWRAVHEERRIERMVGFREQGIEYDDCRDEDVAAAAIEARHRWTWAALSFLRWLLES